MTILSTYRSSTPHYIGSLRLRGVGVHPADGKAPSTLR